MTTPSFTALLKPTLQLQLEARLAPADVVLALRGQAWQSVGKDETLNVPLRQSHPWLPVSALAVSTGQVTQLLLSADGWKPALHWQSRKAGLALADTFTALTMQEQVKDPGEVALLRAGQGRQVPESPMEDL